MISIYGPLIDPGVRLRVKFSDRQTFTLEWAELLNGVIQGSGSLFAVDGNFVGNNDKITSQIPTPAIGTRWLLGSGLICLLWFRRSLRSIKTHIQISDHQQS